MWEGYKNYIVTDNVEEFLSHINPDKYELKESKDCLYYNIPASFDIETSSYYNKYGEKRALMYVWQLGIDGNVLYGRVWSDFIDAINDIVYKLNLSINKRLIIYVHNLAYEFQFMARRFVWQNVFSPKKRRPLYALTIHGVEFRCSYFLANASLAHVGNAMLQKYYNKKLVGNLDYSLARNHLTNLTDEELAYCIEDVRTVMCFIAEKIENDGDITKIPLTNTGYVRNYCRNNVLQDINDNKKLDYVALMKSMKVKSKAEYDQLQRAFMGGFTHTSALHHCNDEKVWIENVGSADLTSSYPYVMVAQYFPMTSARIVKPKDEEELRFYLSHYCCLFDIEFINLRPKVIFDNIISESKCSITGDRIVNNGRVVSADVLKTTCTELDYDAYTHFYTWDNMRLSNFRIYERGYLPKSLIMSILDLYEMKTTLKGVEGSEVDYMISKNMINAVYGMSVTNIVRDDVVFKSGEWVEEAGDVVSQLAYYNRSPNRFLFYAWGIWVTAHARHNLYQAILEFGCDYVYADTDSIKGINFESHKDFFDTYNKRVKLSLLSVSAYYKIPFSKFSPKTKNGIEKPIGVWEIEEGYKYFKSAGAKRYIYVYPNGKVSFTVSGLNKTKAIPYLIATHNGVSLDSEEFKKIQKAYSGDKEAEKWLLSQDYKYGSIFVEFDDGMYIPRDYTGKTTMTYCDGMVIDSLIDYQGNKADFVEYSYVHAEPQDYRMGISAEYMNFLKKVQPWEY